MSDVEDRKMALPLTDKIAERFNPIHTQSQNLTVGSIKKHLPKSTNIKVTQAIVDKLNSVEEDCGIEQELFEEQVLSYIHLAKSGGLLKLMNALKFFTLTQIPSISQVTAYRIVFPDKAKERDDLGKDVSSYACMYAGSKMVTEITKMQVLGFYITHAHLKNWGISKMVDLANGIGASPDDRVSATVQLNATIAIMDKVAPPEDNSIELKLGMSDDAKSVTKGLMEQIAENTKLQRARLDAGEDIGSVQRLHISSDKVIEAEVDE